MPYKTTSPAHDAAVLAAELAFQNAGPFTTQAMAKTADVARLTAIINSGVANGINVINQVTALHSLTTTGAA